MHLKAASTFSILYIARSIHPKLQRRPKPSLVLRAQKEKDWLGKSSTQRLNAVYTFDNIIHTDETRSFRHAVVLSCQHLIFIVS